MVENLYGHSPLTGSAFYEELIKDEVENAAGEMVTIEMPRTSWAYLKWLDEIAGVDMKGYIKDCDETSKYPLHEALPSWLNLHYEGRELEGRPRPAWLPPLPEEHLQKLRKERKKSG